MRNWLSIAALTLLLQAAPLCAQRRGGFSGGGMGRGGFAARGSMVGGRVAFGTPRSGVRFGTSFRSGFGTGFRSGFRRPFSPNRFYRSRSYYSYPLWGYGYAGAFYVDPGYYDYGFAGNYAYPSANVTYSTNGAAYADQESQSQQNEIDRLEDEVSQLREDRAARAAVKETTEPQPATVVVFRDQHTEQVQNYAVVGPTLWIFTQDHARKVPLSDVDLPATQKTNEDHGVEFHLPG